MCPSCLISSCCPNSALSGPLCSPKMLLSSLWPLDWRVTPCHRGSLQVSVGATAGLTDGCSCLFGFRLSIFKVTFGVPETDHHLKLAPFHFVDAHDSNGERWDGPRDGELLCDATSRPSENAPCGVNQIFKALLQLLVLLTPSVIMLQIVWVEWQNTSDLVHTGCS